MEREIKFRGIKELTHGEWVYGGYFSHIGDEGLEHCIFDSKNGAIAVYEHTITQFTGLSDKNGKEIYEGDIVKCGYGIGKVVFQVGCFMVEWIDDKESSNEFLFSRKGVYSRIDDDELFEVIGNIFENPELLTRNYNS